jgi:hypothetical protein
MEDWRQLPSPWLCRCVVARACYGSEKGIHERGNEKAVAVLEEEGRRRLAGWCGRQAWSATAWSLIVRLQMDGDMEAEDLREWILVGHSNIDIVDALRREGVHICIPYLLDCKIDTGNVLPVGG